MGTKGNITRERIIKEATILFNKKGIGDTSISDIQAVTGLTKGSLYFYFSSKDELTIAVLKKARQDFLKFLDSSLKGKTPGECLDNFLREVLEKHRRTGFVGGCIFGNTALEMSDKDRRVSSLIKEIFDEWRDRLEKIVEDAQSAGQIRNDLPARNISNHIVTTIEGGIMLSRLEKKEDALRDCLDSLRSLLDLKT